MTDINMQKLDAAISKPASYEKAREQSLTELVNEIEEISRDLQDKISRAKRVLGLIVGGLK